MGALLGARHGAGNGVDVAAHIDPLQAGPETRSDALGSPAGNGCWVALFLSRLGPF